jgi:hypothetical protein
VKPTETPEQHERSLERKRDTLRRHRERAKSVQAWERLNAWLADLPTLEDVAEDLPELPERAGGGRVKIAAVRRDTAPLVVLNNLCEF